MKSVATDEMYHKNLKHLGTQNNAIIVLKFEKCMSKTAKDADGTAISLDLDQAAPESALSASILRMMIVN